jgi:hypothetical protein
MKDLMKCSLEELLTERQKAINTGNLQRYRECNEIISTIYNSNITRKFKEAEISALTQDLEDLYGFDGL